MKTKILPFIALLSILLAACSGAAVTPVPTLPPPTETPILVPTLAPPENTPTPDVTATAALPANPIPHLTAGTEVTVSTINMVDASHGWAIGSAAADPNEHILLTADGGSTWKDVTPPEGTDPSGGKVATAFFKGSGTAWVIYSNNVLQSAPGNALVWKTTDGGANWSASQPIVPPAEMEFFSPGYFSFPDDQNGWLLVHAGAGMSHDYIYVYGTTDGGTTWTELVDAANSEQTGTGPSMSLYKTGMAFADAQKGWITYDNAGVAPGLTLYGTADGGHTWALQSLPAPANQTDLFTNQSNSCRADGLTFLNATQGSMVVTCSQGSPDQKRSWLYQTSDAGASWRSDLLPAAGGDLQMVDAGNGYYVGGRIFRSTDGGKSWVTVIAVTWSGQPDFIDMNNGWLVAIKDSEKALVQTTNAAVNWKILKTVIGN